MKRVACYYQYVLCMLTISSLRISDIVATSNHNGVSIWSNRRLASSRAILPRQPHANTRLEQSTGTLTSLEKMRGGGTFIPAGWNPMGYKITTTGEAFLALGESLTCDVGRFLASLKSGRKTKYNLKAAWLEIVRHSKTAQAMRIYRSLDDLLQFCLKTGMID